MPSTGGKPSSGSAEDSRSGRDHRSNIPETASSRRGQQHGRQQEQDRRDGSVAAVAVSTTSMSIGGARPRPRQPIMNRRVWQVLVNDGLSSSGRQQTGEDGESLMAIWTSWGPERGEGPPVLRQENSQDGYVLEVGSQKLYLRQHQLPIGSKYAPPLPRLVNWGDPLAPRRPPWGGGESRPPTCRVHPTDHVEVVWRQTASSHVTEMPLSQRFGSGRGRARSRW